MTLAALQIEQHLPATLTAPGLSEAEFLQFTQEFPDSTLEYTHDGILLIRPPTDPETSARVALVARRLGNWAEKDGRGMVIGPDGGFFLPNGARRSPDAAWFDRERWRRAKTPGTRFPVFTPEFVVEVRSPAQRGAGLRELQEKMAEYTDNGVELAWLIDPEEQTVTIYRPGCAAEVQRAPVAVAGGGSVSGFVLEMDGVLG